MVSVGQKFGSLAEKSGVWSTPPQVFYKILIKMLSRAVDTWQFDWGWRISFQDGVLFGLAGWCWLLPRRLSFLPYVDLSIELLEFLYNMAAASPRASDLRGS